MKEVPSSLRVWFIIHFYTDMFFGIPLLLFPERIMLFLGWSPVDPITPRIVGAALMGIGIESWLGRHANLDVYRAMLNLKVIWSGSAIFGIALGLINGGPPAGWVFLGIFAVFCLVWIYYWRMLKS